MKLKNKLFLSFGGALLVPSIAIGATSYIAAQSKVKQEINQSTTTTISVFNQSLTNTLTSWEADVSVLAQDINTDSYPKDTNINTNPVDVAFTNFVSEHHNFLHIYVGTNRGIFIQRPYSKMPASYDPRKRPWYQDAMKHAGQTVITPPYKDASTGEMVITIAKELPNQQGVVGADVALNTLNTLGKDIRFGSLGYLAVTDATTKQVIVNGTLSPGTVLNVPALNPMYQSNSGAFSYTLKGSAKDMVFNTNPITGWKISGILYPQDYRQAARPILWTTIWVIIVALLGGGVLTWLFVRAISKRLNGLAEGARVVAQGDLTFRLNDSQKDEFGLLAESFDHMTHALAEVLTHTTDTAQQVSASAQQLTASAEETSQATKSIATTMQEVAAGSETQAQRSDTTSAAMKEMSAGVQHIAVNAQNVTSSAMNSSEAAKDGYRSLQSVAAQMNQINQTSNTLAQAVERLGQHSDRIGSIVDVITEIASQTNLLALNAAIEAARAGDAGRGFAVVAEEVRKLAEQSSQSASEIAQVIQTIQSETGQTVKETTEVSKAVQDGLNKVTAAGDSFTKVQSSIEEVSNQIQEVSAAVEQLSASSDEVANSLNQISEIASTTSAGTQNVSAAAEEQLASMEEISASASSLSQMAETLQDLVSRFKLN
ncbi:methyl-accepting chemotaxis protein [Alicyclobacillus tolerans]|uniref:methyl-accepting chemotaxis protein n=1 Tax=Alicyclobacillus tolerans TaxID=90970 RepID=UPI001F18731F|nr:methyl-accepting chemotaxis protein [Alicyclobacillus tolerans]MCF8567477.1 methyl-accepting chemotaxis protein [Alicyclobacillus tolerans]